jgi:pimeloyl-ACP methyl ester carboxylesterase
MDLFFRQRGQGTPLIFIHGFPLHQGVWDDFADRFSHKYKVLTLDLPGFGKSPLLPASFSIGQVADQVLQLIEREKLEHSALIGHSLGGYVALAMIEKRPDLFSALVLFHSTALADTPEKKESRNKVVDFVSKNGALTFTTGFIAPLFANPGHPAIDSVRTLAGHSSAEAVLGYTKAMRDRPDQTKTLKNFKKPTLFLVGNKDPGIPLASVAAQAALCQYPEIHILQDVGHMGMFEKAVDAARKIEGFLPKI